MKVGYETKIDQALGQISSKLFSTKAMTGNWQNALGKRLTDIVQSTGYFTAQNTGFNPGKMGNIEIVQANPAFQTPHRVGSIQLKPDSTIEVQWGDSQWNKQSTAEVQEFKCADLERNPKPFVNAVRECLVSEFTHPQG